MSRLRVVVLGIAVSLIAVSAGCGDAGVANPAEPSTTEPASSRPSRHTTSTEAPTSAPQPGLRVGDLTSCDPDDGSYSTAPDWFTDDLPPGVELVVGKTSAFVDTTTEQQVPTAHLLAEVDAGVLLSAIKLTVGAGLFDPFRFPGQGAAEEDVQLDSVRGRPGRIARLINRGDPVGSPAASWREGESQWVARSSLDVPELGQALSTLEIDGDQVEDPSGRFEVIGSGPDYVVGPRRVTELEIAEAVGPDGRLHRHYVRIDPVAEGTTGITQFQGLPWGPADRVSEVGGRLVLTSGSSVASTLADGSMITIRTNDETSTPTEADPDTVQQILTTLRPRTPADDERLATIDLVPATAGPGPFPEYCLEN